MSKDGVLIDAPNEALLLELQQKHATSELNQLSFIKDRVTIVLRNPTRPEFKYFRDSIANKSGDVRNKAVEALVEKCLVYPTLDVWSGVCDRFPGLPDAAGGELMELMGMSPSSSKKAL